MLVMRFETSVDDSISQEHDEMRELHSHFPAGTQLIRIQPQRPTPHPSTSGASIDPTSACPTPPLIASLSSPFDRGAAS